MKQRALIFGALVAAFVVVTGTAASALSDTMGNDATDRAHADAWVNFVVVDRNKPAPFGGSVTEIDYYAERAGEIRFLIVDGNDVVTWVSDPIVAVAGPGTHVLPAPETVSAGSNLGVYSADQGVISYDGGAGDVDWTGLDSGLPGEGDTIEYHDGGARVYSMNATVTATDKNLCKNGGWASYGYRNQGQCVSSVVASPKAGKS